jgi:hypothetical protein
MELRSHTVMRPGIPLQGKEAFFNYVVAAQQRYWILSCARNGSDAIVAVASASGAYAVGELLSIFAISQEPLPMTRLGEVHFLKCANNAPGTNSAWAQT